MKFKQLLKAKGYPENIIERSLAGVNLAFRQLALTPKGHERLLPFVTTYHPAVKKFKTNIDGTLESDTQSALAENNFYKTNDHPQRHACESKNVI